MKIIAIETSHDDTSLSVVQDKKILYLKTLSQAEFFAKYGGTIPELASRQHVENLLELIKEIKELNLLQDVDYIAYTQSPGLLGTLHIGYLAAQVLSFHLGVEALPINHLEGHLYAANLLQEYSYPLLGIIVSGGHSLFIKAEHENDYQVIGTTLDDAIGEVYDKIATRLGIGFPGGPAIQKLCQDNNYETVKLNNVITKNPYDLSFSGIKSQVINLWNDKKYQAKDLACSLEKHLVNLLINKVKIIDQENHFKSIVIGGGVSANKYLREQLARNFSNVIIPPIYLSTDNAAMIAAAAEIKLKNK